MMLNKTMKKFRKWLALREMAAKHITDFGPEIPMSKTEKDDLGIPLMTQPGFRKGDRILIHNNRDAIEQKLNVATEQYGVHWLIGYIEPERGSKEEDPADWEKYKTSVAGRMKGELDQWTKEEEERKVTLPPPNPENTIVYVKPTSRVHAMTPHEQLHNMGHAIWLANPVEMQRAKQELTKAVHVLQQAVLEADPESSPSEAECTIMLGRLIDLLSVQRTLVMTAEDFEKMHKLALTGFNAFDECIFDLFPAFINARGRLNLYPRGAGKVAQFCRISDIKPNDVVTKEKCVRSWVWTKMASDKAAWDEVSSIMTGIIVRCLQACTWAKKKGPIFPYDKITTKP
jgi:hypothetical protein